MNQENKKDFVAPVILVDGLPDINAVASGSNGDDWGMGEFSLGRGTNWGLGEINVD